MSAIKLFSIVLAGSIFIASCTSTTRIQSEPKGAKLYMDNQPVGTTPYIHSDTKIVGTCTSVRIEKEGYQPFNTTLCRDEEADVGAIIGGVFLLVPFLWTMKYHPMRLYELIPLDDAPYINEGLPEPEHKPTPVKSKADRLREMKELLDEGILTQEEYDLEKQKILNEE